MRIEQRSVGRSVVSVLHGVQHTIELFAVDRLSTSTVGTCEITALNHESFDDAMEDRVLEVQRLARLANAFLTSAKSTKVLGCSWYDIGKQFEHNATSYNE
jgi:hypothetical protein